MRQVSRVSSATVAACVEPTSAHLAATSAAVDTSVHNGRIHAPVGLRRLLLLALFAAGAWLITAVGGTTAQAHADVPKPAAGPPSEVVTDLVADLVADQVADVPVFPSGAPVPSVTTPLVTTVHPPALTAAPAQLVPAVGTAAVLPTVPTAGSSGGTGADVPDDLDELGAVQPTAGSLTGVLSMLTAEVRQVLAPVLAGPATVQPAPGPARAARPAVRAIGPDRAGVPPGPATGRFDPSGPPRRSAPVRVRPASPPGQIPVPPAQSGHPLPTDAESGPVPAGGAGAVPANPRAGGRPSARCPRRPSRWGTAGRLANEPPVSPD